MANKVNFTAGRVGGLECEKGKQQSFYWDAKTPSLGVRVTATGKKTYIFESRIGGQSSPMRMTIGDVRTYSISEAQQEANRLKGLTDKGIDPRELAKALVAKDAAKKAEAIKQDYMGRVLVSEAWADYIEYQKSKMNNPDLEAKTKKKGKVWGKRHLQDHIYATQKGGEKYKRGEKLTADGVLYPLLQFKLVDINSQALMEWVAEENKRPKSRQTAIRQGFEKFRTFWNWCAKTEPYKSIIDKDAVLAEKLVERVPDRADEKLTEEDVLQRAYIADWFRAVQKISNSVMSAYLQCLLITGARRNELAVLKWSDIDFKSKTIWLKDKVKNAGRTIPLNLYMERLIDPLPRRNEYVFSSPESKVGYLVEPRGAHNQALEVAGIPYLTIHGLRRSFASLFIWTQPDGAGGRIQGHIPKTVRDKYYLKLPIELIAQWHDGYVDWLLTEAGIPIPKLEDGAKRLKVVNTK